LIYDNSNRLYFLYNPEVRIVDQYETEMEKPGVGWYPGIYRGADWLNGRPNSDFDHALTDECRSDNRTFLEEQGKKGTLLTETGKAIAAKKGEGNILVLGKEIEFRVHFAGYIGQYGPMVYLTSEVETKENLNYSSPIPSSVAALECETTLRQDIKNMAKALFR
jgi:hypothetical protein